MKELGGGILGTILFGMMLTIVIFPMIIIGTFWSLGIVVTWTIWSHIMIVLCLFLFVVLVRASIISILNNLKGISVNVKTSQDI